MPNYTKPSIAVTLFGLWSTNCWRRSGRLWAGRFSVDNTLNVSSIYDVLFGPAMTPRCLSLLSVWKTGSFVVQSCTKLCINFCHWPHLYSLRPRRHSCCLTIKTDCRNFINSFALQTFINLLGLSHLYILWLRFVNCIIKEWIQYNTILLTNNYF